MAFGKERVREGGQEVRNFGLTRADWLGNKKVVEAHKLMESNNTQGKIICVID